MEGLVLVRTIEASQGPEQPQLGPQHAPSPGAVAQLSPALPPCGALIQTPAH